MRVVLVSTFVPVYTTCLANALAGEVEVHLAMPGQAMRSVQSVLSPEVRSWSFEQPPGRSLRGLKMGIGVARQIESLRPDVVHIQGGNIWLSPRLGSRRGAPLVSTIHDPWLHPGERKLVDFVTRRLTIRRSRHVFVHGERLRWHVLSRSTLPPVAVTSIPLGEFSIYTRLAKGPIRSERPGSVLFFGRIRAYKGLPYLARAAPAILKRVPSATIVAMGEGDIAGLDSGLTFFNQRVPDEEVATIFSEASIVVLPYTDATQSAVIPLAYAFGKPVVASAVGAIPEIVDDGLTGILVPPKDPAALADAVVRLLTDSDLRRRMGLQAREKAMRDLSWQDVARRTMAGYRSALSKGRDAT